MEIPFEKVIPRSLALAVVAYCLWPTFVAYFSEPSSQQPKKTPELSAAMLSPKLAPPPTRDPFAECADSTEDKNSPGTNHTTTETAGARAGSMRNQGSTSSVGLKSSIAQETDKSKSLILEATCIVNDRRLAVIDGRLYAPKDKLVMTDGAGPPYEIVEVLPYKVLLNCENKIIELTFPGVSAKPATAAEQTGNDKTPSTTKQTARPKKLPAMK